MQIREYYTLTKPGIIAGNSITTVAGFLLASKGQPDPWLLTATVVGLAFVIASACVFNNIIDKDIDGVMNRTKKRATVTGTIESKNVLIFATSLGLLGFSVLSLFTNPLTVLVAFTGLFFYVVVYGFWKRRSIFGTEVGSIAGAMPIVVGYTAAAGTIDSGAVLLFLAMVFWQMPHFHSIAIYRAKDYSAVGLPVLPVKKGLKITKISMTFYIAAFILAVAALRIFDYTTALSAGVMVTLGIVWLSLCLKGFWAENDSLWARRMFLFSLVVLLSFSLSLATSAFLP